MNAHGVNTADRALAPLQFDVGRRIAQAAAEFFAAYDPTGHSVRPPEQSRGALEIALLQRVAYRRAAHSFPVHDHARHLFDGEAERGARGSQHLHVPFAPAGKAKIVANDQPAHVQRMAQQAANESGRVHVTHRRVEARTEEQVDAGVSQAFELFAKTGQARRRPVRGKKFLRRRLETHDDRGHAQAVRGLARALQQASMTQVKAIERAYRQRAAVFDAFEGEARRAADKLHDLFNRRTV